MKLRHIHILLSSVSICLLMASCHDEEVVKPITDGPELQFNVSMAEPNNQRTRAMEKPNDFVVARDIAVVPLDQKVNGKQLYLHCTESDNENDLLSQDSKQTRATAITTNNFYDNFMAWGYDNSNPSKPIFAGLRVYKNAGWVTDYMWPRNMDKFRFAAVAPADAEGVATPGADFNNGVHLYYTVPDDLSKQTDLLVANSAQYDGYNYEVVDLSFDHALTGVRFMFDETLKDCKIKSISIGKNEEGEPLIKNAGNIKYSNVNNAWEWTDLKGATYYSFKKDYTVTSENINSYYNGDDVLMVLPQTLADGTLFKIKYMDGDEEKNLIADIGTTPFKQGKMVVFTITSSDVSWKYMLKIQEENSELFPAEGASGKNLVKFVSYKQNQKMANDDVSTREAVTVDYTFNGATGSGDSETLKSGLLTQHDAIETKDAHKENTGLHTLTYDMAAVTSGSIVAQSHKTVLSENTYISDYYNTTTGKCYNLSNPDDPVMDGDKTKTYKVQNTANTYVIDGPGWYCLPLVYGNGYKNGAENPDAYKAFKSTAEHTFNSPWITAAQTGNFEPNAASLVSEEVSGSVEPNTMDIFTDASGHKFLRFHVTNNINQGNAVIAVKNNDRILWSWQLWFTAFDINKTIALPSGKELMPYEVGFKLGNDKIYGYPANRIAVKITQHESGYEQNFVIYQKGKIASDDARNFGAGSSPFYQWGRKDPFPSTGDLKTSPYSFEPGTNRSNNIWDNLGAGIKYYDSFAKPTLYYNYKIKTTCTSDGSAWGTTHDWQTIDPILEEAQKNTKPLALWGEDTKTIFDPSPVGFRVPKQENLTNSPNNFVSKKSRLNNLWTVTISNGKIIYLPVTSSREAGNATETNPNDIYYSSNRANAGCFWLTTPYTDATLGYRPRIARSTYISDQKNEIGRGGNSRGDSMPVMPIKE